MKIHEQNKLLKLFFGKQINKGIILFPLNKVKLVEIPLDAGLQEFSTENYLRYVNNE